jgi:hypothetical protein
MPGFIVRFPDGVETLVIEVQGGAIAALYAVRNPDKLRHLSWHPARADRPARTLAAALDLPDLGPPATRRPRT